MPENTILRIRQQLMDAADEKTKANSGKFFKEEVKVYGVRAATVVKMAKEALPEIRKLGKSDVFALAEELLKSGFCEEAWIAADWVYWYGNFEESDIVVYERWMDLYIDNWAECDTLCNHTVGSYIEKYPRNIQRLKQWAVSGNLWLRRAAAVSLIIPAKKGGFLEDIFEIAEILLTDKEDMVQKGYGWMLKEASRKHQSEVFEFVVKNKEVMPRTALRYAIEKMPQDFRSQAMERTR